MPRIYLRILACLGVIFALLAPSYLGANTPKPLLMEGKKTIFQRIITHPEAAYHQSPGGTAGEQVVPFSVFYVYGRKNHEGQNWLHVAPNTLGKNLSWLKAGTVSDWKQSLVLLFAGRVNRDPLLFFKKASDIESVAGQNNIDQALNELRQDFKKYTDDKVTPPDSFPVLAMEPGNETGSIPYDHFYLMPIFSYKEPFEGVKFLEVGSIDPGTDPEKEDKDEPDVKNAIAFVIDTTVSMGPYIEKSRQLTRDIYDAVVDESREGQVALGIVAFRNSTEIKPRLEYISKIISPLRTAENRSEFEADLAEIQEARSSTHSFDEDSLAGIKTAIEDLEWGDYNGRIILLITDAGPLDMSDPYISTAMTTREMADIATQKDIKIIILHIKTPQGTKNHEYAEETYKLLSFKQEGETSYISWEAPSTQKGADDFQKIVDKLVEGVSMTLFNKGDGGPPEDEGENQTPQEQALALGKRLGYSIRLDYVGKMNKSTAPHVVRSWITDKDIALLSGSNRTVLPTVEVAVLLSKDQLSALSRQLKNIIDNAERVKRTDAKDFFASILSASAQISRDPGQFTLKPETNLGEIGVLGEFLDGLPYHSDIMGMTERDWYNMSIGQQTQFVNRLKSKLARYEVYDKDVDQWAKFSKDHPGDWLYRVPLAMLP